MATKARKDSRGYALKKGESQRKDGRYVFRYTTIRGEQKAVYAKELSELRKKEVKIRRAIEDGLDPDRAERITLNELFDEYIPLEEYDHIFYNEIAGYCKCLEDMGFVKNIRNDIQKELNKPCKDYGKITMTDKEISDFVRMCMEPMVGDFSKNLFDSINF